MLSVTCNFTCRNKGSSQKNWISNQRCVFFQTLDNFPEEFIPEKNALEKKEVGKERCR